MMGAGLRTYATHTCSTFHASPATRTSPDTSARCGRAPKWRRGGERYGCWWRWRDRRVGVACVLGLLLLVFMLQRKAAAAAAVWGQRCTCGERWRPGKRESRGGKDAGASGQGTGVRERGGRARVLAARRRRQALWG